MGFFPVELLRAFGMLMTVKLQTNSIYQTYLATARQLAMFQGICF